MFSVQEPIGKPMLMTIAKKYKKEAVDIFKSVLVYMGDRASKSRTEDVVLLELSMCPCKVRLLIFISFSRLSRAVGQCWSTKELRDELFLQLCKQTTANTSMYVLPTSC